MHAESVLCSKVRINGIDPTIATQNYISFRITLKLEGFVDNHFMHLALLEGEKGRLTSAPNPWVGCVIVKNNQIVGQGYHPAAGKPHAEVFALKQAQEHAKEATVYTTLEPCSHFGKTPPCVNALVSAGISRVVIGIQDPDPRVQGNGIAQLRQAGIKVDVGILEEEVNHSLAPYIHHRKTGLPYCVMKVAMSIDGRTAAADGSSQWITNEEAREDVHLQRAESQAIVIGSGTAIKDLPQLTVRLSLTKQQSTVIKQPLRVLLDSSGRVPVEGPLFNTELAPTLVVTTNKASVSMIEQWKQAKCEVVIVPLNESGNGVNLIETLKVLSKRGVLQVLVEGGPQIHGSFLDEGLIQRLSLYVGPCLLGSKGQPLFYGNSPVSIDKASKMKLHCVKQFDNCLRIDYL